MIDQRLKETQLALKNKHHSEWKWRKGIVEEETL